MNFFDTKLWNTVRNNKKLYGFIHNSIGLWIKNYRLRDRIREMKTEGRSYIFEIDRLLANSNCIYFVDFGTLLGFIRKGKPLSWDYDIDFGICLSECFQWTDLEKVLRDDGFQLVRQFSYHDIITEQTYRKNNLFVDFFSHFTELDSSHYYIYYEEKNYQYKDEMFRHARVTKTVKITDNILYEVDGGKIHVPKEYEQYLEDVYGHDWRIPNPNWTVGSMPNITKMNDFGIMKEFEYKK